MAGEIIRQGDPTSHGGHVLEGSLTDICFDKPIAFMGHKTYCPKCRGTFPIIEGAGTTTFYGKGVALAGMKTACGAILIATQFTDTVDYANGRQPMTSDANHAPTPVATTADAFSPAIALSENKGVAIQATHAYDLVFKVQNDQTEQIQSGMPYRITLDDGTQIVGITDASGLTERICADYPRIATIDVPYYADHCSPHTDHEHCACDC